MRIRIRMCICMNIIKKTPLDWTEKRDLYVDSRIVDMVIVPK
jgi:hypothetical protein